MNEMILLLSPFFSIVQCVMNGVQKMVDETIPTKLRIQKGFKKSCKGKQTSALE